jgi:hypothetical protein
MLKMNWLDEHQELWEQKVNPSSRVEHAMPVDPAAVNLQAMTANKRWMWLSRPVMVMSHSSE